MIDLYFRPTANGHKITILLEEVGCAYRLIPMETVPGEQFGPQFLRISPNNKMPAIVDHAPADGGDAIPVFESGAILIYLADKAGAFLPRETRGRTETLQWLMWQMAGLGPMSGQNGHFRHQAPNGDLPYARERYAREVERLYVVLNQRLHDRTWIAGDYSIADIACHPWIATANVQGIDLADFPAIARWFAAVGARDAVQRAYDAVQYRPSQRLEGAARLRRYEQTGSLLRDAYRRMATETTPDGAWRPGYGTAADDHA